MEEKAWSELGSLSRPLEQALRSAFKRPALVALSVEDEASAKGLVSEAIGVSAGGTEHGRLSTALLDWAQKHRRLEGRFYRSGEFSLQARHCIRVVQAAWHGGSL